MDGGTLKNSSNQEIFILGACTLQKISSNFD